MLVDRETLAEIEQNIVVALCHAEDKHPKFPSEPGLAYCILAEEVGEVVKAINDWQHHGGTVENIRHELAQVGAMVIRCMAHLPAEE